MSTPNEAVTRYRQIVTLIGHGFHPDTPGDGYTSLPDGITPQDVDDAIAAVIDAGHDPYSIGLEVLTNRP